MLQLPTGSGKTRIAGELLAGWLTTGRKAVWLTHRRELASQTESMLQEAGVLASRNMAWPTHTHAPQLVNGVVILMAQTVSRRTSVANVWAGYNRDDLMVIDESHHVTARGWERAVKQWPGPVLGMTATPWRLSQREGFDHLFEELLCGPQVSDLQADGWLCRAQVLLPPEEDRIRSGQVDSTGDYSESGIELANEDWAGIMTAGALEFWRKHGENRQTVVYAVSVRHAQNLAAVFNDAGIPVGVILGDTPTEERASLIAKFGHGAVRALINVSVATEGFDLPDAACVIITRPTMSLSLYLQMVGRGLRPKRVSGGNCVVLDLAGNSLRHGLPDAKRIWSLYPRGNPPPGDSPVTRCPKCEVLSAAGSHCCDHCGTAFGELCDRCGAWRAWKRWSLKQKCGRDHDPVCDLCHYDAHLQARLPVTEEMKELATMQADDELSPHRDPFLKNIIAEEVRRVTGDADAKRAELGSVIRRRESELLNESGMDRQFELHLRSLPSGQRPASARQNARMYTEWEAGYLAELRVWKQELAALESQSINGQLIYDNARTRVLRLFDAEAREAGLIVNAPARPTSLQHPVDEVPGTGNDGFCEGEWTTFVELAEWAKQSSEKRSLANPTRFQDPRGKEVAVKSWSDLLVKTAEWLVEEGLLTADSCPVTVVGMKKNNLIDETPTHPDGRQFGSRAKLSNGLYLNRHLGRESIARHCGRLVAQFGQDPPQFRVWLASLPETAILSSADAAGGKAERVQEIRSQTHQSWSNIRKAVRDFQGLHHAPFGTLNVENSAKSCVRKIRSETGLTFAQIETLMDEQSW